MSIALQDDSTAAAQKVAESTVFAILLNISFCHLLNDTIQSLIPSIYPIVKDSFRLSFAQIGVITLTFQMTASLLQPFVGLYTDKRPQPFSLAIGMACSLAGLLVLAFAGNFTMLLVAVGMIGVGSSIFHPEASKVAYMAGGERRGLAQSIFQVGGNAGSSIGPLLAALIIVPYGQVNIIWFSLLALIAIIVLITVGKWYKNNVHKLKRKAVVKNTKTGVALSKRTVVMSVVILLVLIFSKYFYLASMVSYYTFYLIDKFHLSVQNSQIHLFIFLFAVTKNSTLRFIA